MGERARIMCVAGEASGDLHGGPLVSRLLEMRPDAQVYGMGLGRMAEAGMELIADASDTAVVGLTEALRCLPAIKRNYDALTRSIKDHAPELLIVIDTPEIGLRLARVAKAHGSKVLYYIGPQVWAWRPGRMKTIRACVDAAAVVLPYEEALYRNAGVPVEYVGHPLVAEARRELARPAPDASGGRTVLLLPGSRKHEIKRMLPVLCRAAQKLKACCADLEFTLLVAPGADREYMVSQIRDLGPECALRDDAYPAMREATLALAASGTITLQLALCRTPMVVIYRMSRLSFALVRPLIKVPFISLVNLLADKALVPELIQHRATPEAIRDAALEILNDDARRLGMRDELRRVTDALGVGDSATNAARMACGLLSA